MSLEIRPATSADAVLIAELSRKTFYETFAHLNSKENMDKFMNEQFTTAKLEAEVENKAFSFFIAYADDQPAGYLKLSETEESRELDGKKAIEIARIYADTALIGKGVGKALMQKALETAAAKGCELIWLGVWEENKRAIEFYKKWGFVQFGTHVFWVGDDPQTDWLMKKEMQP